MTVRPDVRSPLGVRVPRGGIAAVWAAALLALPPPASAQMFKDAQLDALYAAQRFDEIERAVADRVKRAGHDPQTVLATGLLALRSRDDQRRRAALRVAEECVQRTPNEAACQYTLGLVLGVQAHADGWLAVAGALSRVAGAVQAALDAEPTWFAARSVQVEYLLAVPRLLGGSVPRARELARTANRPDQVRALQARIALHEKMHEQALDLLMTVDLAGDSALAAETMAWGGRASNRLVSEGRPEKPRAFFNRIVRERPALALGPYGLGRIAAAGGQHEEALRHFERAARLSGAIELPLDYRSAISLQALGRHDAAREALRRFVAADRGGEGSMEDARRRLAELGG